METSDVILARIVVTPGILGGKPCISGTRISVEFILELVASGASKADILLTYSHLAEEDVEQALKYGALFSKNRPVVG